MTDSVAATQSLLTYQDVAELTRLSVRTIQRKVAAGEIRAVEATPGHPRIAASDYARWLCGLPAAGGGAA